MTSPLRPELHRRLILRSYDHHFGDVKVVHENEEMGYSYRDDDDGRPGRKVLDVHTPGEYYRINCPFCGDTRGRLWINYRWGLFDEQTRTRNLWLCCCYNENCLEDYPHQRRLFEMVFEDLAHRQYRDTYDPVVHGERPAPPHEVRPPGPFVYGLQTLEPTHVAVMYLRDRGYDVEWLSRILHVGFCPISYPEFRTAQGRIIIPVYHGGLYVGWQARYPYEGEPPGGSPKYYTMPGMKKTSVLYNYDVASQRPFVVLTEGVTKVWSVGPEAVAQLGDKLSSYQAQLITQRWQTAVIYLDGDASGEDGRADEAWYALKAVPQRVLIRLPDGQEPGDFTVEENRRIIYNVAQQQGVTLPMEPLA